MKKGQISLFLLAIATSCHMDLPPEPIADFSASQETCTAPCTVTFTSTSQNAESVEWDFDGENGKASGNQVSYTFKTGRKYYVKLVVKGTSGGSQGITKTIDVAEEPESKPVAKFRYEPTGDIFVGDRVTFINQSDNSARQEWDFGDDFATSTNPRTSAEDRPVHQFSKAGPYTVKLTAYNSKNDSDQALDIVNVKARAVVADFELSGTENCTAPCEIGIINKSQNADTFQWTFGNGTTYTGQNPGKAFFENGGTYRITLIASGPGGSDTTFVDVVVKYPEFTAVAITGAGSFWGNDVVADAQGNVYACGFVSGQVDFGNGITANGNGDSNDLFVAKYDKTGKCVWAKVVGGAGYDEADKIVLDNAGSVYISGEIEGTINVSPTPETFGGRDGFVAKLNAADGNFQWFKTIGGPQNDAAYGLAYSSFNDRIYIAGKVTGGGLNFNGTIQTATEQDIFFVFVNPATGEVRQPTIIGGPGDQVASAVVADHEGNAYLTGYFNVGLKFPENHNVQTLTSMGQFDGFVAKWVYNPGKWQWAGQAASSGHDTGDDIAIDNDKNVYITGTHNGTMPSLGIGSRGDFNVFAARWNANGQTIEWARNGVNDGATDYAGGIAITPAGNLLIHGTFSRGGQFPFNENNTISNADDMDVFLSEIGPAGGHSTGFPTKSGGGRGNDRAKGVYATPDDHIYSIGSFAGTATFNSTTLTSKSAISGGLNIFIVKWK